MPEMCFSTGRQHERRMSSQLRFSLEVQEAAKPGPAGVGDGAERAAVSAGCREADTGGERASGGCVGCAGGHAGPERRIVSRHPRR